MKFDLTYQDYLWGKPQRGDDNYQPLMSEREWNALDDPSKFSALTQGFFIHSSDPRWAALADSLGETDKDRNIYIGRQDDWSDKWMIDPSKVVDSDNGFRFASSGQESAKYQADNDFGLVQYGWALPLGAAAIAAGAGALGAGEAVTGGMSSAINPALLEPIATGSTGTAATALTASPEIIGATGAAGTTPAGIVGGTMGPEVTVPGSIATTAPGAQTALVSTPEIASANPGWWNSLSPTSQRILANAASQGASSLLNSNAQRNAQRAAEEKEQREREDKTRRHQITQWGPSAFTRNAGIIGSQFVPRGR